MAVGRKLIVQVLIEDADDKVVNITTISNENGKGESVTITSEFINARLQEIRQERISGEAVAGTAVQLQSQSTSKNDTVEENRTDNRSSPDHGIISAEPVLEKVSKSQAFVFVEPNSAKELNSISSSNLMRDDESGSTFNSDHSEASDDTGGDLPIITDISKGVVQLNDCEDTDEGMTSSSPIDSILNINYNVDDFLNEVNRNAGSRLKHLRERYVQLPNLSVNYLDTEVEYDSADDESYREDAMQEYYAIDGVLGNRYNPKTKKLEFLLKPKLCITTGEAWNPILDAEAYDVSLLEYGRLYVSAPRSKEKKSCEQNVFEDKFLSDINVIRGNRVTECTDKKFEFELTNGSKSFNDSGLDVEMPDIGLNFKEMVLSEPADVNIDQPVSMTETSAKERPKPKKRKPVAELSSKKSMASLRRSRKPKKTRTKRCQSVAYPVEKSTPMNGTADPPRPDLDFCVPGKLVTKSADDQAATSYFDTDQHHGTRMATGHTSRLKPDPDSSERSRSEPGTGARGREPANYAPEVLREGRWFACAYCDYKASRKDSVKEHERRHTGERMLCSVCEKTFSSRQTLHSHKKRKHSSEFTDSRQTRSERQTKNEPSRRTNSASVRGRPKNGVTVCQSRNLVNETSPPSTFTDKWFSCPACPAKFSRIAQLVEHVEIHEKESPGRFSVVYSTKKRADCAGEKRPAPEMYSGTQSSDEENQPPTNAGRSKSSTLPVVKACFGRCSFDEDCRSRAARTQKPKSSTVSVEEKKSRGSSSSFGQRASDEKDEPVRTQKSRLSTAHGIFRQNASRLGGRSSDKEDLRPTDSSSWKANSKKRGITDVRTKSLETVSAAKMAPGVKLLFPLALEKKADLVVYTADQSQSMENVYKCSKCAFSCRKSNDLKVHETRHIVTTKLFPCPRCCRSFASAMALQYHKMRAHMPKPMLPIVLLDRVELY